MQHKSTLYSLQLFRFIASLLVLLFHLELMKSGYKGVDIFFVISGFVMYYTTFVLKPKDAVTFIINRTTKIFFLYWMAMIVLYFVVPYKINLSLLKTFLLIPGHASLLGISWSLSYELYFYFIFGVTIYKIAEKYHKHIFLVLFMLSTMVTVLNMTSFSIKGTFLNFLLGQNLWEFLLGILSAYLGHTVIKKTNLFFLAIISLVSLLAILFINIPYLTSCSYIVYGMLSFLLILCATAYEKQIFVNKNFAALVNLLGGASYAIYLFGPIVTSIVGADSKQSKIIIITGTIICAVFVNQFIEDRFLRICRNFLHRMVSTVH